MKLGGRKTSYIVEIVEFEEIVRYFMENFHQIIDYMGLNLETMRTINIVW